MPRKRRQRKRWSWSTGPRGATVRVFEDGPGPNLYIGWYEPELKRTHKQSLRHTNKDAAKRAAVELSAKFANGGAPASGPVTILKLKELYETPGMTEQGEQVRARSRVYAESWVRFLGADFDMCRFDLPHWRGYVRARSSGAIDAHGNSVEPEKRREVGETVVRQALEWLRHAIRLAMETREGSGHHLLQSDPTRGRDFKLPKNPNVKRPVYTAEEYDKLFAVADEVHPYVAPLLAVARFAGRRLSPYRQLRWSDWQPDESTHGAFNWPAATDKFGKEWQAVPVTPEVRAALEKHRQNFTGLGDAWIFPDPANPACPLTNATARKWLLQAEKRAGVEHLERRAWHGFRRQFASELRHHPIQDVMYLGGWTDAHTPQTLYQQVDREGLSAVVADRRPLKGVVGR